MAQRHAAVIDQARLVDRVTDFRLIGLSQHVIVAEDVLITCRVFDQCAERSATAVGDIGVP